FRVYTIMSLGVENVRAAVPVLKRQITVSDQYSVTWGLVNADKVLSSDYLKNFYFVPQTIWNLMPASEEKVIAYVSGQSGLDQIKTFSGWLENYPTYQYITNTGKVQVSQEWTWNDWVEDLYTIVR